MPRTSAQSRENRTMAFEVSPRALAALSSNLFVQDPQGGFWGPRWPARRRGHRRLRPRHDCARHALAVLLNLMERAGKGL